ncbi:hypothetical protein [Zavarzinia sp. CC-PAN008]|uniref:hypothetical protein n=1 Tax=Zavarzinia sp. CC-PAN008 TaxID=3243332 RepID=UPI003F74713A
MSLSACETVTDSACPSVARLKDTERVTVFRPGSGRDITDILYEGEVTQVALTCRARDESISVDVKLAVVARRGPVSDIGDAEQPIFAVAARGEAVALRTGEMLDLSFNRDGVAIEETTVSFEIPREGQESPRALDVLVGFVLTREQLAFNRFRAGAFPVPQAAPDTVPLEAPEAVLPPE